MCDGFHFSGINLKSLFQKRLSISGDAGCGDGNARRQCFIHSKKHRLGCLKCVGLIFPVILITNLTLFIHKNQLDRRRACIHPQPQSSGRLRHRPSGQLKTFITASKAAIRCRILKKRLQSFDSRFFGIPPLPKSLHIVPCSRSGFPPQQSRSPGTIKLPVRNRKDICRRDSDCLQEAASKRRHESERAA